MAGNETNGKGKRAHRASSGVEVVLFWRKDTDDLTLAVSDEGSAMYSEVAAARIKHSTSSTTHTRTPRPVACRTQAKLAAPALMPSRPHKGDPDLSHEPTELRLDYKDIVAGKLVIVIQGLPTEDGGDNTSGEQRAAPPPGSRYGRHWPLIDQVEAMAELTGHASALFTPLMLAAWKGQEPLALELITATLDEAVADEGGSAIATTEYARAVLYNGLGRYPESLAAAQRACRSDAGPLMMWAQHELVEAAARSNAPEVARSTLDQLGERGSPVETDWTRGVQARSAALLSEGEQTDDLYREAMELIAQGGNAFHLARAQLVYGEWLRRQHRRLDARAELRTASQTFHHLHAFGFAARALRELLATGETARKRLDEARDTLTPQEAQIARLASEGLSNPEIGARLFISPRTVQYHLRKVFRKLGIASRSQLGRIPVSHLEG